jgi:hypothetical protein
MRSLLFLGIVIIAAISALTPIGEWMIKSAATVPLGETEGSQDQQPAVVMLSGSKEELHQHSQ